MIYEAFEAEGRAIPLPERSDFQSQAEFNEARREYGFARRAVEARFGVALGEEHLGAIALSRRPAVADAVFNAAWAQGHSSGYSQVENDYMDIAQVALVAYAAATS